MAPLDVARIRQDFPALNQQADGRPVVYLDNACMTAKPRQVLEAMQAYYHGFPGCHGRAAHRFGRLTTDAYEAARAEVARLIGAPDPGRVVFTKNSTEAINLVAAGTHWRQGDRVLTSDMEHNSNHLPWLAARRRHNIEVERFALNPDGTLDEDALAARLTPGVRLVSVFNISNVTGAALPLKRVVELAHAAGARVLVDAAQGFYLRPLDVTRLGVDYLALSLHKLFGPTGVGILYGAPGRLEELEPLIHGGEMVRDVTYDGFALAEVPGRFEAGLQNYAGAMGGGAAARYLSALPAQEVLAHVTDLNQRASRALEQVGGIKILGPADPTERHGILNFYLEGKPSEHVAQLLDQSHNIMVRAGVHCVHAWYHARGLPSTVRASFTIYNMAEEADLFAKSVADIARFF